MREDGWQRKSIWLKCGEQLDSQAEDKASNTFQAKTMSLEFILITIRSRWRDLTNVVT